MSVQKLMIGASLFGLIILLIIVLAYIVTFMYLIPTSGEVLIGKTGGIFQIVKSPQDLFILIASTEALSQNDVQPLNLQVKTSTNTFLLQVPKTGQVETNWIKDRKIKCSFIFASMTGNSETDNFIPVKAGDKIEVTVVGSDANRLKTCSVWAVWGSMGSHAANPIKLIESR
jgi:hypothetical protein